MVTQGYESLGERPDGGALLPLCMKRCTLSLLINIKIETINAIFHTYQHGENERDNIIEENVG